MIFKYICDHLQILVLLHMLCYAVLSHFSCVQLFATLWTVACQAVHGDSPSTNTGVDCHAFLQGNLPNSGIEPTSVSCTGRQVLCH